MIAIENVTMRYGGVTPLDDVSIEFPVGVNGLIGPNGAGKTTMFNVLSGFARPVAGRVRAFDTELLRMPAYRRARWGVRRSFQTEQTIGGLSVADNVGIVLEHSGGVTRHRRAAIAEALDFVGLAHLAAEPASVLNARERRVLEIARAVVGEPRLVLLDEPAAGLTDDETTHLIDLISRIPEEKGALVILVDHDMTLVSSVCARTAVLDFGRLIAAGPTADVLRDEHVQRAYLGTDEGVVA